MAIHDTPFYHKTIRNLTTSVGTIFDNLAIQRGGETIRIPLQYRNKEHWYAFMRKSLSSSDVSYNKSLPMIRMSISDVAPNLESNVNKNHIITSEHTVDDEPVKRYQFSPTAYIIGYEVNLITDNTDDGLQLLEQVLPYFNPDINIKFRESGENSNSIAHDVQVKLDNVSYEDNYEQGFDENRYIIWSLSISAEVNMYMPVREQGVIRTVCVDIDHMDPLYDLETMTLTGAQTGPVDKEDYTLEIEIGV